MTDLVSVIIPVYNAEAFLEKCVKSIENQTYEFFELILVNDGSADSSGRLCDKLAETYANITVIHQKNSGASCARNNGMSVAKGKYIIFCDSDDYIESTMLEKLCNAKEMYPELLPVCGIAKVSQSKHNDCILADRDKLFHLDKKDFFIIQKAQLFNTPVNKLYEKAVIEKHALRFPPEVTMGEDFIFNANYVINTGCDFAVVNEPLYIYLIDAANSVSKKYIPTLFENYITVDNKFHELIDYTQADMNIYGSRYATILLFSVINSIKNTMSPLNPASTGQKIKYIKKILNTFDIKDIISKADTSAYSDIYIKMLCTKNAWLIYTFRTIRK